MGEKNDKLNNVLNSMAIIGFCVIIICLTRFCIDKTVNGQAETDNLEKTELSMDLVDIDETAEKNTIEEVDKAEPYVFHVRDLENVRPDGTCSSDFYITSAATGDCLYYMDAEGVLYGTRNSGSQYSRFLREDEEATVTKIAENVIHVDCCELDVAAWITAGGQLYVAGSDLEYFWQNAGTEYASPYLLMGGVRYVRCGRADIVIMKEDGTVWVWGTVSDGQFQGSSERLAEPLKLLENAVMITGTQYSHAALLKDGTVWTWGGNVCGECGIPVGRVPMFSVVCAAQDVQAVWMGELQYNLGCTQWERYTQYPREDGYNNLIIKKRDGNFMVCGEGISENGEFMPCEIVQDPDIVYDGINTYHDILAKYEMAWKSDYYTVDEDKEIARTILMKKGTRYSLCYSLKDLTGDQTDELVIGYRNEEEQKYYPCIIYSYDVEESVIVRSWDWEEPITLYEDGSFESVRKGGVSYYQLQKDSAIVKIKAELTYKLAKGEDLYYLGDIHSDEVERELTEEEYWEIIAQYERKPQAELEWKLLDGFWVP